MVARRRIRGEAHRRLMAQRVAGQNAAFLDHLEERQHEVAGDAENFARAVVFQAVQQRGAESRCTRRAHPTASCLAWRRRSGAQGSRHLT